jgi:hypothetical protein
MQSQSVEQMAEPDPQLKPLMEANARSRSDLFHCQKEVALMQENNKLSIQLKEVTKHKDALTMVQDRKAYIEKMFTHVSEYPAIEKEVNASLDDLHGPLTIEQLRTEKERIFAERYDTVSNTIKTYPYYMKLMGRDGAYEVQPDFIDTELQAVLADLRLDVNVKRYTRWSNMKPDSVCARHHTRFRYLGNGVFACQSGHQITYQCPECASRLDYFPERNAFNCHPCFTKLMDS